MGRASWAKITVTVNNCSLNRTIMFIEFYGTNPFLIAFFYAKQNDEKSHRLCNNTFILFSNHECVIMLCRPTEVTHTDEKLKNFA